MSKELDALHESLKKAQRQVGILCHGFSVKIEPSWDDVVNSVVTSVGEWERTGHLPCKHIGYPMIFYSGVQVFSSTGEQEIVAEPLPPILFKQFKEKFLVIIHDLVVPALKIYRKANPNLDVEVFKPLLMVKLK
jgi:hypothetical protein